MLQIQAKFRLDYSLDLLINSTTSFESHQFQRLIICVLSVLYIAANI